MVATIAFGMGIDKPNIRCVIHYGCPKSLECYSQESGRCGRDGLASICWLYYRRNDFAKAEFYCGEAPSGNQRKAIMESLMAAQRYCMLVTCRRKFLLEYFGEKVTFTNCGNCDNCTNTKKERNISREAFLLLSCVHSCGSRWGLNMPIDVLRGSRSRKIIDNHFDKLSSHGIGKEYSSNWWKSLGDQLIVSGYLKATVQDIYITVSVSPTGMNFLRASTSEYQPPLVLPITNEMDDEDHSVYHGRSKDDLQNQSALEYEGFSEAENKLYHMLLDMRMDLAKISGTAPYAICGDQTMRRMVKIRPSTKARLANIDGVNMYLVTTYGDEILQQIDQFSRQLNLSMDGEAIVQLQTSFVKTVHSTSQKKLVPTKHEAWKRWQDDGLTFQEIANFPGRAASIKEQTVCEYVLEAGREGFEIDWARFCQEIRLTRELFTKIRCAIEKIGSRERLKPIKEELPEHVSYLHIKLCLTMLDLHVSTEIFFGLSQSSKTGEFPGQGSELSQSPNRSTQLESSTKSDTLMNLDRIYLPSPIHPIFGDTRALSGKKQSRRDKLIIDEIPSSKCHKIGDSERENILLEATECAVLEWLRGQDGAVLPDIIKHFKGSKEDHVISILNILEGEFLIFRRKDLYRVM